MEPLRSPLSRGGRRTGIPRARSTDVIQYRPFAPSGRRGNHAHDISRVVMHHSISRLCGHQPVASEGDFDPRPVTANRIPSSASQPGSGGVERIRVRTTIEGEPRNRPLSKQRADPLRGAGAGGQPGTVKPTQWGLDLMGCNWPRVARLEPVPDNLSRFVERTLLLRLYHFIYARLRPP